VLDVLDDVLKPQSTVAASCLCARLRNTCVCTISSRSETANRRAARRASTYDSAPSRSASLCCHSSTLFFVTLFLNYCCVC